MPLNGGPLIDRGSAGVHSFDKMNLDTDGANNISKMDIKQLRLVAVQVPHLY